MEYAAGSQKKTLTVRLEEQLINAEAGDAPDSIPFAIDPFRKHCLLNGLDDIGLTLEKAAQIDAFEAKNRQALPWLYS